MNESADISARGGTGQGLPSVNFMINPAINTGETSVSFTHGVLLLGSYMNSLSFTTSIKDLNTGLYIFYFNSGDIEYIPEDVPLDSSYGTYSVSDIQVKFNISKKWNNISLGISPIFYMENILQYSSMGYAMDMGLFMEAGRGFSLGASLMNWHWIEKTFIMGEGYAPPFLANIGVSYGYNRGSWTSHILLDFSYHFDIANPELKIGFTERYKNITFSIGQRFLDAYKNRIYLFNKVYGPSAGLSLRVMGIEIDYSFQYMFMNFNPVHKITLRITGE